MQCLKSAEAEMKKSISLFNTFTITCEIKITMIPQKDKDNK